MSLALATVKNSGGFVSGRGACRRPARGAPSTLRYPRTIAPFFDETRRTRPGLSASLAQLANCSLQSEETLLGKGQNKQREDVAGLQLEICYRVKTSRHDLGETPSSQV